MKKCIFISYSPRARLKKTDKNEDALVYLFGSGASLLAYTTIDNSQEKNSSIYYN
jgi:hypothetical protein